MARNILILSDGTGQVGGYEFDEDRANVYKLYRATRVGPDSCIDPHEQAAFYDPGLGSRGQGGFPNRTLGTLDIQKGQPGHRPRHHSKHHRLLCGNH
jgi:uncharacterized protein (DUF2235 family)